MSTHLSEALEPYYNRDTRLWSNGMSTQNVADAMENDIWNREGARVNTGVDRSMVAKIRDGDRKRTFSATQLSAFCAVMMCSEDECLLLHEAKRRDIVERSGIDIDVTFDEIERLESIPALLCTIMYRGDPELVQLQAPKHAADLRKMIHESTSQAHRRRLLRILGDLLLANIDAVRYTESPDEVMRFTYRYAGEVMAIARARRDQELYGRACSQLGHAFHVNKRPRDAVSLLAAAVRYIGGVSDIRDHNEHILARRTLMVDWAYLGADYIEQFKRARDDVVGGIGDGLAIESFLLLAKEGVGRGECLIGLPEGLRTLHDAKAEMVKSGVRMPLLTVQFGRSIFEGVLSLGTKDMGILDEVEAECRPIITEHNYHRHLLEMMIVRDLIARR